MNTREHREQFRKCEEKGWAFLGPMNPTTRIAHYVCIDTGEACTSHNCPILKKENDEEDTKPRQ